jgi:hypothetical protein
VDGAATVIGLKSHNRERETRFSPPSLNRGKARTMKIYSGKVCVGNVGDEAPNGFHVGDIVMIWHVEHAGSEFERWEPAGGLTAIVSDDDGKPFVMGIKQSGFDDPAWRIDLVKKFSDVVSGERWPAYGFSYADV